MDKPDYTKEEYNLQKSKENVQHLEKELKNSTEESSEAMEAETKFIEDAIAEYQKKIDQLKNDKVELQNRVEEQFGIPVLQHTTYMSEEDIRKKEIMLKQNKLADQLEEKLAGKEKKVLYIEIPVYCQYIDPLLRWGNNNFVKGRTTQISSKDTYIIPNLTKLRTQIQLSDVMEIVEKAVATTNCNSIEYSGDSISEDEKLAVAEEYIYSGKNVVELSKILPLEKLDLPLGTVIYLGSRPEDDEVRVQAWLYKEAQDKYVFITKETVSSLKYQYADDDEYGYAHYILPTLQGSLEWSPRWWNRKSHWIEEKEYTDVDKSTFERLKPIIAKITGVEESELEW